MRVGYVEKVEYWAALWGTVITAVTGLVLWFENLTLTWLPGWVPEAATVLHFLEAILATLAILVWHFYSVIFDPAVYPMDPAWLTGKPTFTRAEERGEVVYEDEDEDGVPRSGAGARSFLRPTPASGAFGKPGYQVARVWNITHFEYANRAGWRPLAVYVEASMDIVAGTSKMRVVHPTEGRQLEFQRLVSVS